MFVLLWAEMCALITPWNFKTLHFNKICWEQTSVLDISRTESNAETFQLV